MEWTVHRSTRCLANEDALGEIRLPPTRVCFSPFHATMSDAIADGGTLRPVESFPEAVTTNDGYYRAWP